MTRFLLPLLICSALPLSAHAEIYGWWPLDDGDGDVARDLGPRVEEASIFDHDVDGLGPGGSVWVEDDQRGTVLGLGGNTAWVSAGVLPVMDLENQFSWSFWARQPTGQASPANDIVIGNRYGPDGVDTDPREFIKFTPNRFEYHMNGTGNNDLPYGTDPGNIPSNDVWIHHSVVKEGDEITYYRDGEVANTGFLPEGQTTEDPLPFALGGQDGRETWRGFLSDVQLYESALSQSDLQNVMTGTAIDNAGLYGHWKLDDGNGWDEASDSGPRSENANIFNFDFGGLGDGGSVWVDDPDRGTVLGLAGDDGAWVDAGDLPIMDLDNNFTWSFWARQDPGQASPANDIIIGNRYGPDGVDTDPREFIKFTPDRFEFHTSGAATGDLQYSEEEGTVSIPSNDEWIHHTVVKDGDSIVYYRDGDVENQRTIVDPMFSDDPLPFNLGGQEGGETWQGFLSDVRLFDHALTQAEIDQIIGGSIAGDYNRDGVVDAMDADAQARAIQGPNPDLSVFDENGDGVVDANDRLIWVHDHAGTWVGDANLDGEFNSGDFVLVFTAGLYDKPEESGWAEGDWNGDLLFNSSDFVAAFTDGGYNQGPAPAAAAVPEPTSLVLVLLGALPWLIRRRA